MALHDICQYQMSSELLICKCPFSHLICKIAQECRTYDLHFQVYMVMVLQEVVEYYMTSLMEDTKLCPIYAKHVTIMLTDIQLAHHICGEHLHY